MKPVLMATLTLLFGGNFHALAESYVLKGKVMDSSDNWLNGAQVMLGPVKARTRSDANGEFTLKFDFEPPAKVNKRGIIANLVVSREGHITKRIPIRSLDFFTASKPLEIKLEPQPVDPNLVGFTMKMEAPEGRKGTNAEFHVYVPESVEKVKAAFFISRHGMGDITKPVLRKFAAEEQVALVGMFGDPVQRGVDDVSKLDPQIKRLAEMSGHPELAEVPVMTFGHSNGTGFAASWPRDRPEKTIAWVGFHPGFNEYLQFPNTDRVPAMIMCGTVDKYLLRSRQDQVVANLRKTRNAAMNLMMEGGVGHGPADADATWEFITEFLKSAMRTRLGDDGKLKPVKIESGWLGELYDFDEGGRQQLKVTPYSDFEEDRATANWLPDEEFAKVWQAYGRKKPGNAR